MTPVTSIAAPVLDFRLPPDLEAREPPEARGLTRDGVRLLVSTRGSHRTEHAQFRQLPALLRPGDLVVANDSATLPAALEATLSDGRSIPLHLSTRLPGDLWVVEPRGGGLTEGAVLSVPGEGRVRLLVPYRASRRLWLAALELPLPVLPYLETWGRPITYAYVRGAWPLAAYQTVYARVRGSAEMPSAGRPFTHELISALLRRGIGWATVTLHAGVASLEQGEAPTEEPYTVPWQTADAVARTRERGGRVVAVGTTTVRALESAADASGRVVATTGWTDLMIVPPWTPRVVDGLLTGFHEPRATHLAMLEALAGRHHLARAYEAALEGRYLWHEFGDVHLIL